MSERVFFTEPEVKRLTVIHRAFSGLSARSAADMLDLSAHQVFRLKARVRTTGDEGIRHYRVIAVHRGRVAQVAHEEAGEPAAEPPRLCSKGDARAQGDLDDSVGEKSSASSSPERPRPWP
jgi:hypothetical protein